MEEDLADDCYSVETDDDYEFDACQFYDFTRPEIDSEIEEVDRWFEISGDYPHSPFVVKLNLEKILCPEVISNPSAKDCKNAKSVGSSSETDSRHGVSHTKKNATGNPMLLDGAKAKTKQAHKLSQPRSSTLMAPTASHLAKQYNAHDQRRSTHICKRFERTSAKLDKKNSCVVGFDNLTAKRQKLETGYLKKGYHLNHLFSLSHKSKKVTIPKEPELETQLRAEQRRRSKNSSTSIESDKQKQKGWNFKAHPLNRKILQPRPLPIHRKRKPRSQEIQETKISASAKIPENKLIGQFTELSLGSNMDTNTTSQLKIQSYAKRKKPK